MEGKGGCESKAMLRCAGGAHDNKTTVERIMLGFRPIAPKPVTGGNGSGILFGKNNGLLVSSKRSKRKYVRVRKNNNGYRRKKNKKAEMVTLQLFPEGERVDLEDSTRISESGERETWLGFGVVEDQTVMVVESWVTVESVTWGCVGKEHVEIMKILDEDTCPGFISGDGLNHNVKWVNGAYKKMVMGEDETNGNRKLAETAMVKVELVMKEKLPSCFVSVTCRARVEYMWHKEKKSKVVTCDVWRMKCGAYAWRLDVDTALSLGR